jgi:hypothetical protein
LDAGIQSAIRATVSDSPATRRGVINMAVMQRWAATGSVDADATAELIATQFLNGMRSR